MGMIRFCNFNGFKWNFGCKVSRCSVDLITSSLYITCIRWIEFTELGLIVQGLQEESGETKAWIRYYLPLLLQVAIFLNGFVPDIVYCNSLDNVSKNNSLLLTFFVYACFGTSFFIYKYLKFAFQISKKLKHDYIKSIASIQPSTKGVMLDSQKDERQKFKNLYRKFILYSTLGFVAFAFQLNQGFPLYYSDSPPDNANSATLFFPTNHIFIYLQMIFLATLAYNNNKTRSRSVETLKLGVAIGYFAAFGIWFILFIFMTCFIFHDYAVYVTVLFGFLFLIFGTLFLLRASGVNSREQELLASINFIEGNILNWRNVMFIIMEVLSLSIVSLDSLYLWWAPVWMKELAFVLFNGVSSSDSDYLEYMLPHVSSRIMTNSLITYIFILILLTTSLIFLRLPKLILRSINFLSYLTFDIFIMTISSLLLRRLKCHDPLQGNVRFKDSLIGTGYLIGYNEIICNNSDIEYMYTLIYLMGIISFLVGYGLVYFLLVRNKSSLPNVWDIPGFTALKMVLKFAIVCGINLTPKDYVFTPWIRATINLFCVLSIALTSFKMMPCLGPQAEFINLYRTSAYSFAFFCSLMSFISLILLTTCGLENEMAGNIMSVLTIVVPSFGSVMVFFIIKRKKHSKLNLIKRVCELATSNGATIENILKDYEESISLYGAEENPFSFLPALTLHYSSDTLIAVFSSLKLRLESFVALNTFYRNYFEFDGIPSAFSFLEMASQYPEGSQVIKRKFLHLLVNCFLACDKYYFNINLDAIQIDKLDTNGPLNQVENAIVPLLEAILIPLSKILLSICLRSKFYVHELSAFYPLFFPLVLKLRNFNVFFSENEFYEILEPHSIEVVISSIDLFDGLLNVLHNQEETENLLISMIIRKGNDLDRIKVNALQKELGNLIKPEGIVFKFKETDKIKNENGRTNEDKEENISSTSSPTNSPFTRRINSSLVSRIASSVRFGANRVFSKKKEDKNKNDKGSTFSEKFALCDKNTFQSSTLEYDALLIMNINPSEITKDSIIETVEDIFGKMKVQKRKRLTEKISFRIGKFTQQTRKPRVSKFDITIDEILSKKNKVKVIVVIAVCAAITDSKLYFHSHIEKVKQEFMEEWRKEDNPLKGSIEIVLEIEGVSEEQEEEMFGLKRNKDSSISKPLKEYISNLTSKAKKIMLERQRKKEFWSVNGVEA